MVGRRSHPPNPTNLFVEGVPPNLNNMKSLSRHFERFGEIVNVQINQEYNKAYVQFRTHEQAKRAIQSPAAVCNNRFIKVKWATYNPRNRMNHNIRKGGVKSREDEVKIAESKAQESHKKAKKCKILMEIMKRKVFKLLEKQKRLLKMLGSKDIKKDMRDKLKGTVDETSKEILKSKNQMNEQKEKMEKLEKEAKSFEEAAESARQAGREKANKPLSKPNTPSPTIHSVSYPNTIKVLGLSEGTPEMLKTHFEKFGTVLSVEIGDNGEAKVTFNSHHDAIKAMEEAEISDKKVSIVMDTTPSQEGVFVRQTTPLEIETVEDPTAKERERYADSDDSDKDEDDEAGWRR